MPEQIPRIFRIIVPAADIEAATRFYRELLGTDGVRVSPDRHDFRCGGVILACYNGRADGDAEALPPNSGHLYLSVDTLEPVYEAAARLESLDASEAVHGMPSEEIHTRPWGERSFYAVDPHGNRLCFVQSDTLFLGDAE